MEAFLNLGVCIGAVDLALILTSHLVLQRQVNELTERVNELSTVSKSEPGPIRPATIGPSPPYSTHRVIRSRPRAARQSLVISNPQALMTPIVDQRLTTLDPPTDSHPEVFGQSNVEAALRLLAEPQPQGLPEQVESRVVTSGSNQDNTAAIRAALELLQFDA